MGATKLMKEKVTEAFTTGTLITPAFAAWGSSSTAFSEEDTALGSESERKAITDTDLQSQTVVFYSTLLTSDLVGSAISEAGLLSASTGGTLFIRDTFAEIDKTNQFEIDTEFIIRVN